VPDVDIRDRILCEATRLFARQGYGSTSVRELAEAAGVTKPTLYYYFENKEALFLEVVHHHLDSLQDLVQEAMDTPGTVHKRLTRFIERYVEGALKNIDAVRLLTTLQHPTDPDQPQIDLMSMHLSKIEVLQRLLQEGIDAGELREGIDVRAAVLSFIGTVNLYLVARLHGMAFPADYANTLMDLYCNGVAAR